MSGISGVGGGGSDFFPTSISLPYGGFPGGNTPSQDQHFGVGTVPASGGTGGGGAPALPPGIGDPNTGHVVPNTQLLLIDETGASLTGREPATAAQILANLNNLLHYAYADSVGIRGGYSTPSL